MQAFHKTFSRILVCTLLLIPLMVNAQFLRLYTEEYPPYNYLDNQTLTGLNFEIVKKLCEEADISCDFELMAWSRGYELAKSQENSGIFSTSRNAEREPLFKWVGPLEMARFAMFKLKQRTDIQGETLSELNKYSIGVIRNTMTFNLLEKHGWDLSMNIVEFSSFEEFHKPFLNGRFELLPASRLSLFYSLRKYGHPTDQIEQIYEFKSDAYNHYLALNLSVDDDVVLRLNQQLVRLRNTGWVAELREHYEARLTSHSSTGTQ